MQEITAAEVITRLNNKETLHLIDVREPEELALAKIPGILNIPLGTLPLRIHELDKNNEYIIVCRSGNRSGNAAQFLEYHGFQALNMIGGMIAWSAAVKKKKLLTGVDK
ncbi:rhodanese-like domain-containing protein [Bacillus aquiflavi]|uniref:Rhodanese-like domain-containing protein n=1 Tax=Bacillus aquiflavi TaxID=2672567 RepID=A0A6B3VYH3_9BACI|nr:rhodanese-like domain-containing protein [Bacillus aquiflavi]MBA4537735.1 rhodanese-like domain-containing protein [Bacillus aquiflavi]NEY81992.1 rhodanese-like domain-containing protein [Bacillus aquiflavi]UAC49885.1 rhodanese-like domain-containing protein [Bacillus aquiflavi]